jgi:hypothetical protein
VWPNTESTLSLRKYHSQNRCGLLASLWVKWRG